MKNITLKSGRTAKIPFDAYDWQLFTSKVGVDEAAKDMTTALIAALTSMDEGLTQGWYGYMKEHMRPVMEKYAAFGACDTEPRCEAEDALEKFARSIVDG